MRKHVIDLFMWGYQPHYRDLVEDLAKQVLVELGIDIAPKILLVGARAPQKQDGNPVCLEPEDGEWPLTIFEHLLDSIEKMIQNHPLQHAVYFDEPSMRDKPENIRRDSTTKAVRQALLPYDMEHNVHSFCGHACLVNNHYVVPVIQIPRGIFEKYPLLKETETERDRTSRTSMIHSCISTILNEASEELRRPEPGRFIKDGRMRNAEEIIRISAVNFMHTPGHSTSKCHHADLFERFNTISSMMYEGTKSAGQFFLTNPENGYIEYHIRFKNPVPLRDPRWARKILQMADGNIGPIADSERIYGLGRIPDDPDPLAQDVFIIRFLDHYYWELECGRRILLRSRYGKPQLPRQYISREQFIDNYARIFPESSPDDHSHLWRLFDVAKDQKHGCMIIVAADASSEAQRLAQQGTNIEPVLMTTDLLRLVSNIDGTVLLDPHGECHAIGVILDGNATPDCTPSRGSRFNSGMRYVSVKDMRRLAIVVSDDNTVDILPILRPCIKRDDIEQNISLLESATLDDYHGPRNWLDQHRFYLDRSQCDRVNSALDRIESLPRETGEIVILPDRFSPDPLMDESYFLS